MLGGTGFGFGAESSGSATAAAGSVQPAMIIPSFLVPVVHAALLLVCAYKSFKALEADDRSDDRKWLTFWLINGVASFARALLDNVSFLIPAYNDIYIAGVVYLAFFGGAQKAYELMRPFLKKHEKVIDEKLSVVQNLAQGAITSQAQSDKKE